MHRLLVLLIMLLAASAFASPRYTIIDMHMHAEDSVGNYGPPPVAVCAPYEIFPARDPGKPIEAYLHDFSGAPNCAHKIMSATSIDALRDQSLAQLKKHNMLAVVSGSEKEVADWKAHGGDRVISAIGNINLPPIAREIPKLPPEGAPTFDMTKPDTDFQLKEALIVIQAMVQQRRASR